MKNKFKKLLSIIMVVIMIACALPMKEFRLDASAWTIVSKYQSSQYGSNCVSYVRSREPHISGITTYAEKCSWINSNTPVVGAVAIMPSSGYPTYGHVAYVEAFDGTNITISDSNVVSGYVTTRVSTISSANITGYFVCSSCTHNTPTPTNHIEFFRISNMDNTPSGLDGVEVPTISGQKKFWFKKLTNETNYYINIYIDNVLMKYNEQTDNNGYYSYTINTNTYSNGEHEIKLYYAHSTGDMTINKKFYIDNEKPIISNISTGEITPKGFLITCKIEDNREISYVQIASWTEKEGANNAKWQDGNISSDLNGQYMWCKISATDHSNYTGNYHIKIYVVDIAGNIQTSDEILVNINEDAIKPIISNIAVGEINNKGFLITCKVSDNSYVDLVQFGVWATQNGIDSAKWYSGNLSNDSNGQYAWCKILTSDHKNALGEYKVNILARDSDGNVSSQGYTCIVGNQYQVTFNANGGACTTSSKSVTYGSTYGSLPTPTQTGYSFDGWYTLKDGGTKITADTKVAITANQTLYAHWTKKEIVVKKDSNIVFDEENKLIMNVPEGINSLDSFLEISGLSLQYEETANGFGTGTKVKVMDGTTVLKSYTIVVPYDVTGDGYCDAFDVSLLSSVANYETEFEETSAYFFAGDVAEDGFIDAFDLSQLTAKANYEI